jgi:hypothetical protein
MSKPGIIRALIFVLAAVAIVFVLAAVLAATHEAGLHGGNLVLFDEDLSDSVLGWAIAIPVLILTFTLLIIVLSGTGVIVAGVIALVLMVVVLSVLFALMLAILPFAAFLAVPILVVVGLVKLFSKRSHSPTA